MKLVVVQLNFDEIIDKDLKNRGFIWNRRVRDLESDFYSVFDFATDLKSEVYFEVRRIVNEVKEGR